MYVFVLTLHIVLCSMLVIVILMQPGKGADISSAFGGGAASQLFGAAGPGNFLTRGTGLIAGLFMVTSITLALYSTEAQRKGGVTDGGFKNVLDEGKEGGGFGGDAPTVAPTPTPTPADGAAPTDAPTDAPPGGAPPADGAAPTDAAPTDAAPTGAAAAAPGATAPAPATPAPANP